MQQLTGEVQFTKETTVFNDYIKKWKNKDILYHYQGYGGMDRGLAIDPITGDIAVVQSGISWQLNEKYEAKIINVTSEYMDIELKDTGKRFTLHATDFKNNNKWGFDIYEP